MKIRDSNAAKMPIGTITFLFMLFFLAQKRLKINHRQGNATLISEQEQSENLAKISQTSK
jgi:hypothetical protein